MSVLGTVLGSTISKVASDFNNIVKNKSSNTSSSKTSSSNNNVALQIEELKKAQRKQASADLKKQRANQINQANLYKQNQTAQYGRQRDSSLSNLKREQATIKPKFYEARGQASTSSQLQAKNFAEYMANRGLSNSGASAQGELNRTSSLQGEIGGLNKQELAANTDIEQRRTDVGNSYANNISNLEGEYQQRLLGIGGNYDTSLSSANAGIEADYVNKTLEQGRYNQQFNYQKEQDTANTAFRQLQFDYQKQQNEIDNTYRKDSFEWQVATQQAQLEYQKSQDLLDNNFRQSQFDYQKTQDKKKGSSGGSRGYGSSSMTKTEVANANKQDAWNTFAGVASKGALDGSDWLKKNGEAIQKATDKATLNEMRQANANLWIKESGEYSKNKSSLVDRMFRR